MLNSIWKQLLNRRKKNIWIVLELLLIFCLVWYIVDYFFVLGYNKSLTSHRDINNTYFIQLGNLTDTHPDYRAEENTPEAAPENFRRIINRIKEYPQIETIALAYDHSSLPGLGSFNGSTFRNAGDTTRMAEAQRIMFAPEGDYLKLFRHTTNNGKNPVSFADYNRNEPSAAVISKMLEDELFPGESAIGKTIENTYISPDYPREQYKVTGVIDNIKHFSHSRPNATIYFPMPLNEYTFRSFHITVRTKQDIPPLQFTADFKKEMSGRLKVGNYYLMNISSLVTASRETDYRAGMTNEIRTRIALMIFFFLSILLCVLGTFWQRANVRREEIGIRRALGSDAVGIGRIFVIEGLLLLTVAMLPAMLIEAQLIFVGLIDTLGQSPNSYGNYLPDRTILRFLITNGITWFLMAIVIIVAIWLPARSAGRIKPVDALRDE